MHDLDALVDGIGGQGPGNDHGFHAIDPAAYPTLHEVSQSTFMYLVEAVATSQQAQVVRSGEPRDFASVA